MVGVSLESVITTVRDIVSDEEALRYSDARIKRALIRATKDFTLRTKVYQDFVDMLEPTDCTSTFSLPDNLIELTRVTLDGVNVPLMSFNDMDNICRNWQSKFTDYLNIKYCVYDKLNKNSFRLYPIPTNIGIFIKPTSNTDYGILTIATGSEYGLFYDVNGVDDSQCIHDNFDTTLSFGLMTTINIFFLDLNFYGSLIIEDYTLLDNQYEEMLVRYITADLLRADADDRNRQFGNSEYRLYIEYVNHTKVRVSKNFTSANQHETQYRSISNGTRIKR